MQERSASPTRRDILMLVVILILVFGVYPLVSKLIFPPPPPAGNPPAPIGSGVHPTGSAAHPTGSGAAPISSAAHPTGSGAVPISSAAHPTGSGAAPISSGAHPMGSGAVPIGSGARPAGSAAAPAGDKGAGNKALDGPKWITLGSVDPDPKNPYRMLVTLSASGAAVARLELSSPRYRDLEDRGGYLGHLVLENTDRGEGCLVQVVGAGTPAAKAGVQVGDRIRKIKHQGQTSSIEIKGWGDSNGLEAALRKTEPGQRVELEVDRGREKGLKIPVDLIRRPLEVIRPEPSKPNADWVANGQPDAIYWENNCPLSLLTTLQQFGEEEAPGGADAKEMKDLTQEMPGVEMRNALWTIIEPDPKTVQAGVPIKKVVFSRTVTVDKCNLKFTKTYELKEVEGDPAKDVDAHAYHLDLSFEVTNLDSQPHKVAYRLDGPNGLPVEGAWYATKVQKTGVGLRDVVYQLRNNEFEMAACSELSDKPENFRKDLVESHKFNKGEHQPLFFSVDAQYFSAGLSLADTGSVATARKIERAVAMRVGQINEQRRTLTNTSFRLIGTWPSTFENGDDDKWQPTTIKPGESLTTKYELFAGPKRKTLLAKYGMQDLVYYGWLIFHYPAMLMTVVLEFFHGIVHHYGLAIILLTVVVRLAFFPISRKQAQSAQLMQKIQPKLKELEKKHKGDWKALQAARQELLSKYNYNPASGCLLMFLQLPIFIGLYRALQVNVELRDAPLIPLGIRWCSNLAAPDMLIDWSGIMPAAVNNGVGFPWFPLFGSMLGLGPYLNLFPIITLALFLVQQKVMMPPAADEQAAQQQKIMKFVMLLMGFMFFKVAAGLCIYFIATTLWGLAEKRFLPQATTADGEPVPVDTSSRTPKVERTSNAEREAIRRKKGRKK